MKYLLRNTNTNVIDLLYELPIVASPPLEVVEVSDAQYRDDMLGSIFTTVNLYKPDPRRGNPVFEDWWESDGSDWVDTRDDNRVWGHVREDRNEELLQSDWTQLDDSGLTPPKKGLWTAYRNQLRNVPNNHQGDPRGAETDLRTVKQGKPATSRSS